MNAHPGAVRLVSGVLAEAIRPVRPVPFRAWLPKNIVLVDGAKKDEFWSIADAPYLGEIADCLSVEHPCNWVTVRKAQQTGASILALAWTLFLAENHPDNVLYAVPGLDALQDINSQKLQPLIDVWQRKTGKRIIAPAVSRSGAGSTVYEKRFAGGSITLANANSVMDLSMRTSRYGVKDEVSKWSDTPNGDDPESLFFGRFTAFRRFRTYKIFEISTPEIDSGDETGEAPGHCRIDRSFRRSDQRFWHITCSECAHEFVQSMDGFQIDRKHPHRSEYICPGANCGHVISEAERVAGVRGGRYVASNPGEGRHPGFHVDAFMSLMMSYGDIAEEFLKSEKRGEPGAKNFANLVLALPYAMRGNAPDHERLMERREALSRGVVPADGLILVGGCDVQHDGLYYEIVAFAEDRQTWTVDADFLPGATDNPNEGAWLALDEVRQRGFVDAWNRPRPLDGMAVDAGDGGRTNQVLQWCKQRADCYAIHGKAGRGVPAISPPVKRSVKKSGKRKRIASALTWPVGTWSLKSEFYGNLHKTGLAAGQEKDPSGYCHYGVWLGEEFFKQITAEYFDQTMVKGRYREEWKRSRRDNHWLDCRVYAMAIAEHLGLSRLTKDGWAVLRARLQPSEPADLLSAEPHKALTAQGETVPAKPEPAKPAQPNPWRNRT